MSSTGLPVLLYHHVGPLRTGTHESLTVLPGPFRAQMAWLSRHGFHPVTLSQAVRWWHGEAELPPRALVITFDDGYADLAQSAFPVLATHGFPAVVFVVSGQLAGTNVWDEAAGSATHRLLDVPTLQTWADGIEVAAHSRTHASLDGLTSDEVEAEVVGSKEDLEVALNRSVTGFAYPYGVVTPTVRAVVSRNFDIAFGVREGLNHRSTDRFAAHRTMVQHKETLLDYSFRARLARDPLHQGRLCLGAVRRRLTRGPRAR